MVEKKEDSETQGKKKNECYDGVDESAATKKSTTGLDPTTKTLIHKSIITDAGPVQQNLGLKVKILYGPFYM